MKNTNKTKTGLYIAIAICVAVLLALIIVVITAAGGPDRKPSAEPTVESITAETEQSATELSETEESTQSTQPATEPEELAGPDAPAADVEILFPYGTLVYPGEWAAFLRTEIIEEDGCRVEFYADLESGKTQPLFSLTFGSFKNGPIGMIATPNGEKVNVYLDVTDFIPDSTWTDSEIVIVSSMQEALNDVLEKLNILQIQVVTPQEPPTATEPPETTALPKEEPTGDMALDTPYCVLRFPSRWAENLLTEVEKADGYSVHFYGKFGSYEKQRLFTVHFGGSAGAFFGKVKDADGNMVEVRISAYELNLDESWSSEESARIYAMQEDLNYLLDNLG